MISKTVQYKDFEGRLVEEELFFHLSKTELLEMEASVPGGLEAHVREVVREANPIQLVALFKKFLLAAYGKKSEDGRRFLKSEELRQDFLSSPAYDELFFALATEPKAATEFFFAMVPEDFAAQLKEIQETEVPETAELPEDDRPAWVRENRDPTAAETRNMSREELTAAFNARIKRA